MTETAYEVVENIFDKEMHDGPLSMSNILSLVELAYDMDGSGTKLAMIKTYYEERQLLIATTLDMLASLIYKGKI